MRDSDSNSEVFMSDSISEKLFDAFFANLSLVVLPSEKFLRCTYSNRLYKK